MLFFVCKKSRFKRMILHVKMEVHVSLIIQHHQYLVIKFIILKQHQHHHVMNGELEDGENVLKHVKEELNFVKLDVLIQYQIMVLLMINIVINQHNQ
jgi:hypothetical protein